MLTVVLVCTVLEAIALNAGTVTGRQAALQLEQGVCGGPLAFQ
jgi:exosortase/archaeosortase